jgi:FTR1 family protein
MIESFVITLREGVEAALVICLALAYLRKIERPDLRRSLWLGAGLAALVSIAAAVAIHLSGFNPEGRAEGIILLVSCALVSWLVFWMWRHGKKLKQQTEEKLGKAAASTSWPSAAAAARRLNSRSSPAATARCIAASASPRSRRKPNDDNRASRPPGYQLDP